MSNHSPGSDPIRWFFNACLLILFGIVALSIAVRVLQTIWPWALGLLLLIGSCTIGVILWRAWRRPW